MDEPLARYTSMHVGGPADALLELDSPDDLSTILMRCEAAAIPWFVIAGGTNVIVRDGGVRGLVIRLGKGFQAVARSGERITAGASAKAATILSTAVLGGLAGFEFLAEIPGELGGLVAMNAGASGGEMKDIVEAVTVADAHGSTTVLAADLGFGYRRAQIPQNAVVTETVMRGRQTTTAEVRGEVERRRARRRATQPTDAPNSGSMFKNPPGDFAGRLVEAAGLKGHRVGEIEVSHKHANFFVNTGTRIDAGTARDVIALLETAQRTVKDKFGVDLEMEVHIVGEDA